MKNNGLYGITDPIGQILSRWRFHTVLPLIHGDLVIDMACGDNRLLAALGRGFGIDIYNYGNADIILKDFNNLPFASESIDTITILAALNYFDSPTLLMNELARVLKQDGTILITLLRKPISAAWHKFRDTSLPRIAYSKKELQQLATQAGLRIDDRQLFMLGLNQVFIIRK
jgi:ubiquinone/menaquinone biosynthesis C-methylase UbiE